MADDVKFTEEHKKALEEMLENPSLKAMAALKAIMILASGAPVASAVLLVEALIDSLVNANFDDPVFCEYIRTRFLTALAPK